MANESVLASGASNRDVGPCAPGPFQDCSDVVHLSVFFDGTGNNKDADEPDKKWSNVARMWRAAVMRTNRRTDGIYPIYVSGVGTRFNGEATGWMDRSDIWVEDTLFGMAGGHGGDRRLAFAADNVNARLRDRLLSNAARLGGELAAYSSQGKSKSFAEVNKALGKHRLVKIINLSVFGFSRGAALARAFVNRVVELCERRGDALYYEGYPLRVSFLGLFDTVASFGLPASNTRLPWDERELRVPQDVERCVHYVAAHELRFAFPVDLIRLEGRVDGRWVERCYPGVHSDVGGGYHPINQGISNNAARIPMRDMMRESVLQGVRMLSYGEVAARSETIFRERFECLPATQAAYNGYMRHATATEGRIEDVRRQHMRLLYSAYGTLHRLGQQNPGDRQRQDSFLKYKFLGPKGMAWEVEKYRSARRAARAVHQAGRVRLGGSLDGYAQYIEPQDWQLAAWDATAPDAVVAFVRDFVHDSKVDFVGNVEPFSYFRLRTMQESTRSVWNETGDWIADKAQVAKETGQEVMVAAERKVDAAADWTSERARQARDAAVETYDAAKRKAEETYEAGKRKVEAAYDATRDKAVETYDAARQKAREAYEASERTARTARREAAEAAQKGRRLVEQGAEWVEQEASEAAKAAEEAYRRAKAALGL